MPTIDDLPIEEIGIDAEPWFILGIRLERKARAAGIRTLLDLREAYKTGVLQSLTGVGKVGIAEAERALRYYYGRLPEPLAEEELSWDALPTGKTVEIASLAETGLNQTRVAEQMGLSRQRVQQLDEGWHLFDANGQTPEPTQHRFSHDWRREFPLMPCHYCKLWWMPDGMAGNGRCKNCNRLAARSRYTPKDFNWRRTSRSERKRRFESATLQGEVLRRARLAHGLSQESLSAAIGLKKADQVRLWEKGEREPSPVYLLKIQVLLNLSAAELLGLTNTEK